MKKITLILIAIMMFMTVGCSKKDVTKYNYTYKGENQLWKAECNIKGSSEFIKKDGTLHYNGGNNRVLTVTYKKDLSSLASVKHLKISYAIGSSGGDTNLTFDDKPIDEKTFTFKSEGGGMEIKDQVITVTVSVDGKADTIKLKSTN